MEKHERYILCPACNAFVKVDLITHITDHIKMISTYTFEHCGEVRKIEHQIWKSSFQKTETDIPHRA